MSVRTPSYRRHRPTGQAVVTLNGRDVYLGKHGSPESRAEFDRLLAEWFANGRQLPPAESGNDDRAVNEIVVAYLNYADAYFVKDGTPTVEPGNIRLSVRPLLKLYGHTPARKFGPLALKAVRQALIESGNCRTEVNRRVGRIVRVFKWAVENELVPPSVHHGLKAVASLRKGRTEARENPPIRPVPEAVVAALEGHVNRHVWGLIQLQRLTGARPGEIVQIRGIDLDTSGAVWVFTPGRHKSEHHDRSRQIYLGPLARAILTPFLKADGSSYVFSPQDAMNERWAEQRAARKTRVQPSQKTRAKPKPRKTPGDRYTTASYRAAITHGCKKAGVPKWHPHQLRHNAATRLRREHGLEVSRVILGHTSVTTTEIYAEQDREKALEVMAQVG